MIESVPKFLNGVFPFKGGGYDRPIPLSDHLTYTVPPDKRAQLIYLRAGNSSSELVYVVLMRDGKAMRFLPIGAKSGEHVPLAVVEDLHPETRLEVLLGAPADVAGTLVLDIGILEV